MSDCLNLIGRMAGGNFMSTLLTSMLTIAQTTAEAGTETARSEPTVANRVADLTFDPLSVLVNGLDRFDILNYPVQLLDTLAELNIIWAVIFVILGLLAIANGYQWRIWIVMIISFLVGLEIGGSIGESMAVSAVVAGSIGILVAVIAWPLMKYAIMLVGALAGAFIGANLWTALGQPEGTYFAGALIGFISFGMLSFIAPRVVSVAMTCIVGATMFLFGALALLMQVDGWQSGLANSFESNTLLIPLISLVIMVFGFVLQQGSAFAPPASDLKKGEAKPATA